MTSIERCPCCGHWFFVNVTEPYEEGDYQIEIESLTEEQQKQMNSHSSARRVKT